jgi:cation diffusion facilitator family transporter
VQEAAKPHPGRLESTGPASPETRGARLALLGAVLNVSLALGKLLAGILGHSYALIADAVESMSDVLGSVVIWSGLRIASRPPDKEHPYGHGKAEALAAAIVGLMVLGAGLGVSAKAVDAIVSPLNLPERWTLVVLGVVIVTKEVLFRVVRRVADQSGSTAVQADAVHHRTDAITSLAAAIGISLAIFAGMPRADGVAALVGGGVIVLNGVLLMRGPVHELMDREPSEVVSHAERVARGIAGVERVEYTGARKSGTRYWVDMHVWVDPAMSVRESHTLSHRVKDDIMREMPRVVDVLVHIEPAERSAKGAT